jgi:polysaccharide pyruvyl transferase WcaK-like protein
MNNKGTQALICSDVSVLHEAFEGISISVSTTDIDGVKKLNLPLNRVSPPMVDVPYDKADQISKKLGFDRSSFFYKILTLALLVLMPVQIILSLVSVILTKTGLTAVYRKEVIDSIKNCNVVISHSDENFKETASLLPLNLYWIITWWSMLLSRTWEIMVSRSLGKSVVMFPNSVGPFRTFIGRFLSRLSLNSCDYILIRDPVSYGIIDDVGIKTTKVLTYDTAILFNRPKKGALTDLSRPLLGVSPGVYRQSLSEAETEKYIVAHANALDRAVEKHGFSIVFLPHYISGFKHDDLDVSKSIIAKMKNANQAQIVKTENVTEFCGLLNQMDMVISSKMHPAILAVIGFVPVLCISYDHKQTAFFQRLNMSECILNIRDVSYDRLASKIDDTWNRRTSLEKSLKIQIPKWQKNVKTNILKTTSLYLERESRRAKS